MSCPLLSVAHLTVGFNTPSGFLRAVYDVSFELGQGETVGIAGESGCGKTAAALAIMGLLPYPVGRVLGGRVLFEGHNLSALTKVEMSRLRGCRLSMIFQEPSKALNPVQSVGRQVSEALLLHSDISKRQALEQSVQLLDRVGIRPADKRYHQFPHQLSGGMRQRVMIAMAVACRPALIIADEPTTALDVTVQAQILNLLDELQQEYGTSILIITHDFGVIAETCDRILVMYAGQIVEAGSATVVLQQPEHPYTQGLLSAIPRLDSPSRQKLPVIPGQVPELDSMPPGCPFQNRCHRVMPRCQSEKPPVQNLPSGTEVRCFAVK